MNNREIKFRVWDKKIKAFLTKDGGCFKSTDFIYSFGSIINNDFPNLEVQQFTGLKDKNGKEIYEGDIIKLSGGYYPRRKVIIKWLDGGLHAFRSKTSEYPVEEGYTLNHEIGNTHSFSEVIGNIFENPELMK